MPIRNPASCGAGKVLTPSNEAVRVAPDALSLKEETAVMFPSPEVPPPDGSHWAFTPQITNRLSNEEVNVRVVSVSTPETVISK